ncbi:MAG: 4Fe-4S dicluster domain-containing protein, partial [Acidimicrobiales bacterium]
MTTERRPSRPARAILGAFAALGLLTAASGLVAALAGADDGSPVRRETLGHIPGPLVGAFYAVVTVALVAAGILFARRSARWQRGRPEARPTTRANAGRRLRRLRRGLYMQTLLRDPAAGLMHCALYFGFVVLFGVTVVLEIDHQLPRGAKFLHGDVYRAYSLVADLAGVVFLVGVGWAAGRRYLRRHRRLRLDTRPQDAWVLGILATIGVSGFVAEGLRIALDGRPRFERWAVVGWPLSGGFAGEAGLAGWYRATWVVHVVAFVAFVVMVPLTKLRHALTSPLNMYLSDRDRPKGAMRAMPDLLTVEVDRLGASTVDDLSWKQLLDTDACTLCGRCTDACPAQATGKVLDPRTIVLKVGAALASDEGALLPPVTPEEVWACTTCRACDEACPVDIEILD